MSRPTWAPAGAAGPVRAPRDDDPFGDPFGDRFPTQPLAIPRHRAGLVHDDRPLPPVHRQPPRHHAEAGSPRVTMLVVVAVVIAAVIGALGYETWASSSSPAASDRRADGRADGAVPDGVTVFDDEIPAVAELDPDLLAALREAATEAADDRVEFVVNSGWRSREYQERLLDEAIAEYGSKKEAARWVATPDTSPHVSGDAVDIGPAAATAWLSEHGAEYGLCQVYRNEPWHYELRPDAVDDGCPRMYADPTHDPRMQK